jgi:GTP pyrophosphokinase
MAEKTQHRIYLGRIIRIWHTNSDKEILFPVTSSPINYNVQNMAKINSSRFIEAVTLAVQLHEDQLRKGSEIPYIAHLLAVTGLVLEAGGDSDQAIAALLHDAVEDQGGMEILLEIRHRFGDRVAAIVEGCSDSFIKPKPPWKERKEKYLDHLPTALPEIRLVSLADKLHNARSIQRDLKTYGVGVFDKFKGGKTGTLWYYDALVKIFEKTETNFMVTELTRVVQEIHNLAHK